jgi:hypothetical protein
VEVINNYQKKIEIRLHHVNKYKPFFNGSKTIHIYVVLLILSNFVLFLTVSILVEYRCSNRYVNIFDTMTFDQMSSVQVRVFHLL